MARLESQRQDGGIQDHLQPCARAPARSHSEYFIHGSGSVGNCGSPVYRRMLQLPGISVEVGLKKLFEFREHVQAILLPVEGFIGEG